MRLRPANPTFEPCLECNGDGYQTDYNGPGRYDDYQECWYPSEELYPCDACQGTGHAHHPTNLTRRTMAFPGGPPSPPTPTSNSSARGLLRADLPF